MLVMNKSYIEKLINSYFCVTTAPFYECRDTYFDLGDAIVVTQDFHRDGCLGGFILRIDKETETLTPLDFWEGSEVTSANNCIERHF